MDNYKTYTLLIYCPDPQNKIHNVYELASMKKTVIYLHAALGFPTKYKILKDIRNKWLLSWPSITASVINKKFMES